MGVISSYLRLIVWPANGCSVCSGILVRYIIMGSCIICSYACIVFRSRSNQHISHNKYVEFHQYDIAAIQYDVVGTPYEGLSISFSEYYLLKKGEH